MKRLLLYIIKSILTNPQLLGYGILFILFWGVIGAYVEAPSFIHQLSSSLSKDNVPTAIQNSIEQTAYLQYTSDWYADLVILSLSSIATGIASVLYYQTGTLPYLIRYSKLKASTYFTSLYSGTLIASFILEALLTVAVVFLFSNNGIGIAVTPSKVEIIILSIILASIFFISFATFLRLIIIKLHAYSLRNLFNFIPLILGYLVFAIFTFITPNSSAVYYSNPYMTISILLYYGYNGGFNYISTNGAETTLNLSLPLLLLTTVAWIVVLNIINFTLVRKIYYASLEEGRIM